VLVIGGGVTGAGVARDAAMRGLSVALVEARDFASGTSSRSSKMIHGGLRYMAQGDLALVHEAASERKAVERIAPHLTRQTPFVIPPRTPPWWPSCAPACGRSRSSAACPRSAGTRSGPPPTSPRMSRPSTART
jgi:glycerol-3-phosphate dehydrogenase